MIYLFTILFIICMTIVFIYLVIKDTNINTNINMCKREKPEDNLFDPVKEKFHYAIITDNQKWTREEAKGLFSLGYCYYSPDYDGLQFIIKDLRVENSGHFVDAKNLYLRIKGQNIYLGSWNSSYKVGLHRKHIYEMIRLTNQRIITEHNNRLKEDIINAMK